MVAPLSVFTNTFGVDTTPAAKRSGDERTLILVGILDAAQTVADVLVDNDGNRAKVIFDDKSVAYTLFTPDGRRTIAINPGPVLDPNLSPAQSATVMTAFIVHEIGHTHKSGESLRLAFEARFGQSPVHKKVNGIFDDRRVDVFMQSRYPGLDGVIEPGLEWVASRSPEPRVLVWDECRDINRRLEFLSAATRYSSPSVMAASSTTFGGDSVTEEKRAAFHAIWLPIHGESTHDEVLDATEATIAILLDGLQSGKDDEVEPPVMPPTPTPPGPEGPEGPDGGCGIGNPGTDTEGGDESGDEPGEDATEGGEGKGGDGTDGGDTEGGDEPGEGKGDGPSDGPGTGTTDGGEVERGGKVGDENTDVVEDDGGVGKPGGGVGFGTVDDTLPDPLATANEEVTDGDDGLDLPVTDSERFEAGRINREVAEERATLRVDAKEFGRMKVRFR